MRCWTSPGSQRLRTPCSPTNRSGPSARAETLHRSRPRTCTLSSASGSANFLSRTTAILAVVFFLTTFVLAYLASNKPRVGGGVMDAVKEQPQPTQQAPASQTTPDAAKASDAAKSKANEVPK